VFPNVDGVAPKVDCGFDVDDPLDPNEKAEAGIAPKGDDPKEAVVVGFPKADVPAPKADWPVVPKPLCEVVLPNAEVCPTPKALLDEFGASTFPDG
jgi:hypothetical protein